ncbi:uncharacterized protein LOC125661203 [Ostrea edulis]|uniref:uncharacterized protein LOC125661203 n=1 Tax=Ostrea edulis TaxID=37623 RepID=UPI0024AEADDB|nr:uncharacterized protein LOC125661203 [Ostrea edulis]
MLSRTHYSSNVEKTLRVANDLTAILLQTDFSRDLQQYLSKSHPRYHNALEEIQRDILSDEVSVLVGGERCEAKHQLLSRFCGDLITIESYRKISNADIVIKAGDGPGVKVFKRGEQVHGLSCRVENAQKDEHKAIKEHLNSVADDVSILRGCYIEIVKTDKSKVNATFLDVPDDLGGFAIIKDYLRLTTCFIFVVDISNINDIQKSKKVLGNIIWKLKNITPFHADKVIVVPNKQWSRKCETLPNTNRPPRPRTEISTLAITDAMPFIKVENVFDLHLLKDITQFDNFADRIKREVLFGEDEQMKIHLQFLRGLACKAIKSICVKDGLVQADNPIYEEKIQKVSKTLSDIQQGYSKLSRRSTADIQDVLIEVTKMVSTAEDYDVTEPEDQSIDIQIPPERPVKSPEGRREISSNRVVDSATLDELSAIDLSVVVDSDFVDPGEDEADVTLDPERKQSNDTMEEWNDSVENVADAVSQSVLDLKQAVELSESMAQEGTPNEKFQLLSAFVNQLLTIEDIEKELEGVQDKAEVLPDIESFVDSKITFSEGQERLSRVYESLEKIISLKEYDSALKQELELVCPKYRTVLSTRAKDLKRTDSSIVVAGETNAGKTTLLNKIMGRPILTSDHLSNTGRVCRVRNSQKKGIRLYTKDNQMIQEIFIDKATELKKTLRKYCEKNEEMSQETFHYVDLLFPVDVLKGDVVIVDTPGMNEEEKVKSMLEEYLPNALSFIFVLNVANDGGVQCDRIPKLLQLIQEHKKDMPCFEEQDVLFLINKWDTVAIPDLLVDSDDEEDEQELQMKNEVHRNEELDRIWRTVVRKIKDVWPLKDDRNAFRMTLKEQDPSDEYIRFKTRLADMVTKTENKRMKEHLCFLIEFAHNAERGIKARLRIFDLSEEDYQAKISRMEKEIIGMEGKCKQIQEDLKQKLKAKLKLLSTELVEDMNSSVWKDKALNPPDKKPIKEMRFRDLATEIPARIEDMIKKWMTDGECRKQIEETEKEMIRNFVTMQEQLSKIEEDLMGECAETESDSNVPLVVGIAATSPLWVPLLLIAGVVCLAAVVILLPLIIAKAYKYTRVEKKEKVINIIYDRCIQNLDEKAIKNSLKVVVKPVEDQIEKCFVEYIPGHLKSITETIETLKKERGYLKERKNLFNFLNDTFVDVRKNIHDLRKDLNMAQR